MMRRITPFSLPPTAETPTPRKANPKHLRLRNLCMALPLAAAWLAFQAGLAEETEWRGKSLPGHPARIGTAGPEGVLVEDKGWSMRLDLHPGRYRIEATLRSNRQGVHLRKRTVALNAKNVRDSQTIETLDQGRPLAIDIVNREKTLTLEIMPSASRSPEMQNEWNRLTALDLGDPWHSLAPPHDGHETTEKDKELESLLAHVKEATVTDISGRKIPMILLETLRVIPLSGPVIVTHVSSDRITYSPGSHGTLTVELENLSDQDQAARLTTMMMTELTNRHPLLVESLALPPRSRVRRTAPFAVGEPLWGRGFEAHVTTARGRDIGTHAVSVVTNPWMVAIHGRGVPMFGSESWTEEQAVAEAERIARENMERYCNVYEKFAWAACDYSEMTPKDDSTIYSGQTQYTSKRSAYQILHRVFSRYGIAAITYGKACGGGLAGLEYSHAFPERMHVFGHAGFAHEAFDVDVIDRMLEGRYRSHGQDEDFWQMWISCWTHPGNHATTFYGCDEIARSAQLLGWNGVRYDGEWSSLTPISSACLIKIAEDHIRKQVPQFAFGYNAIDSRHSERKGAFTDVCLAARARGGGLCMDEYYRNLPGPASHNIRHLQNVGDFIRLHGGYYLCVFDDQTPWNEALLFAAGSRPMGGGSPALRRFATRFSRFILDPALRRLLNPAHFLKPVGDLPFRWDAFVYERSVSPTRLQLILQLVNLNDATTFGTPSTPPTHLNPPQTQIPFELSLPPGCTVANLFAVGDRDDFQPQPSRFENGRLTIPELNLWTMVVIELDHPPEAPPLHTLCPDPVQMDALRIEGDLDENTIRAINEGRIPITPEVLDKALALGLPPDTAPGDVLYEPVSFETHRSGRDSGWDPKPAEPLPLARNGHPDVLHARGAFSHRHRLEEAYAMLEGAVAQEAIMRGISGLSDLSPQNPGSMHPWPDRAELARYDIVLLDAVPAPAFSLAQRRDLRDFVAGGGGVFAIGSWYSLSKGQYEGSFLEEALPVRTRQQTYLRRVRPMDGTVRATAAFTQVLGTTPPDFGDKPSVEWISHIEPRPGSQVLMETRSGVPLLVAGPYGQGRAIVWAASNSGQPESPWWQSAWWPKVAQHCLQHLAQGANTVTPPDPARTKRVDDARAWLQETALTALLEERERDRKQQMEVAERLRILLADGSDSDALNAVTYWLEHAGRIDPLAYPELVRLARPRLGKSAPWKTLAARFVAAPPHQLNDLVGELAATALPTVAAQNILNWSLSDLSRLRCLATVGDPAAIPFLQQRNAELDAQEAQWAAVHYRNVPDFYTTRLYRPYILWALWRCGRQDEHTAYLLAKACLDLPYYHWRQHWVLANRQAALAQALRFGGDGHEQRQALQHCERAILDLAQAIRDIRPWFRPQHLGTTPVIRRAIARALAEADSRKSLPLALAYVRETPPEHLRDLEALKNATLPALRHFYLARLHPQP